MHEDAPGQPTHGRWAGETYSREAGHHRSFDAWFLGRHPPQPGQRVIDAGSGSGEFTARLGDLVAPGPVIGVEPDASMLDAARRLPRPNVEYRQGRVQDLDRVCPTGWADLVVSRAVFHWIPLSDYPRCYAAVHNVLRPGGWFHAESGAAGNVPMVLAVLGEIAAELGTGPPAATFPDAGVAFELLEQAGFDIPPSGVTTVAQRRRFDRRGLSGFLHSQAVVAYVADASAEARAAFLAKVDERVERFRRADGSYDQTFVRLDVLCRRPARPDPA